MTEDFWSLTGLVLGCALGSYFWRGLGVWVAHRVDVESGGFRRITCVAFALIAGLVCRVIFLPVGELGHTSLPFRLAGVAVAFIAFRPARRNLLVGVLAGAVTLPIPGYLVGS